MIDRYREPRPWRGPGGFREERGHRRRLVRIGGGICLVFGVLILQVWASTQVDMTGSRISRLEDHLERVRVDLAVDSTKLTQGEIYSELLAKAEQEKFGLAGAYRDVKLITPRTTPQPKGLAARIEAGLRLPPRIFLPEARAQEGRHVPSRP